MSAESKVAQDPLENEAATSGPQERGGVASSIVDAAAGVPEVAAQDIQEEAPPPSTTDQGQAVKDLIARLKPGTVIDEKYVIQSVIGRGGMGVVVSARHEVLRREVALKFLCMPGGVQEDLRARFRREAQVNAKLKNEHVTRVLDIGSWEGISFMVMERLDGQDLRRAMREAGGALPLHIALNYTLQLCEGIAEAHAHGIVHRDLKPSNLFLTHNTDGTPLIKIMDFGISKWKDDEVGEITKDGTILGSPKYMSPEQIFGSGQVDARADVWSIAAICYEMIGGRTPYKEPTLARFCQEIMAGPPPLLETVAQQPIPPALSAMLARCFERDAMLRPQSVAELAGGLLDAVDSPGNSLREKLQAIIAMRPRTNPDMSGSMSIPPGGFSAPSSGVSHVSRVIMPTNKPVSAAPAPASSKTWVIAGGALAALGVLLIGITFMRGRGDAAARADTHAGGPASAISPVAVTPVVTAPTQVAVVVPPSTAATQTGMLPATNDTAKPVTNPTQKAPAWGYKPPPVTAPKPSAYVATPVVTAARPPTNTGAMKADDDIPTMR